MKGLSFFLSAIILLTVTSCKKNTENGQNNGGPVTVFDTLTIPATFQENNLLCLFTEASCSYCPDGEAELRDFIRFSPEQVIGLSVNVNDSLSMFQCDSLDDEFNTYGYPFISKGLSTEYRYVSYTDTMKFGIAIATTNTSDSAIVNVLVGFKKDVNTDLYLVAFLVEDSIKYPQWSRYNNDPGSEFYQQGNPIVNFNHNHVLRKILTSSCFGEKINSANTKAEKRYQESFKFALNKDWKKQNLSVEILVTNKTKLPNPERIVPNSAAVKLGETKLWQ